MEDEGASVQAFYLIASTLMLFNWVCFSFGGGSDFNRRGMNCSIATRPSFLPPSLLLLLHKPMIYLAACHLAPFALLVPAFAPGSCVARVFAAVAFSVYSLAETSVTHSHRDYANLYCCWALALFSPTVARAIAFAVSVNFIACAGYTKVVVPIQCHTWMLQNTMTCVLKRYGGYNLAEGGPAFPPLNAMILKRPWILSCMSFATLVAECILIPLFLFVPPPARLWAIPVAACLHLGIASIMSAGIGLAFLPSCASYYLGYSSESTADGLWCISLFLGLLPSLRTVVRGKPLREDWPCTNLALFAWSTSQWNSLFDLFVDGDTRIVLSPRTLAEEEISRAKVIPKGYKEFQAQTDLSEATCPKSTVVYDGWEQVVGETLVYPFLCEQVLPLLRAHSNDDGKELSSSSKLAAELGSKFAVSVTQWLQQEKKLLLTPAGDFLKFAYFVRVCDFDATKVVASAKK